MGVVVEQNSVGTRYKRDAEGLTERERRFCQEYVKDLNAKAACYRAGYSPKGATVVGVSLLKRPEIKKIIRKLCDETLQSIELEAEYVIQTIYDTTERCKEERPVFNRRGDPVFKIDEEGNKVPVMEFDAAGVFKGAELLGKYFNIFQPPAPIINNYAGSFDISKLSESQLEALGKGILPEDGGYIVDEQE